jgi:predicted secreted protein
MPVVGEQDVRETRRHFGPASPAGHTLDMKPTPSEDRDSDAPPMRADISAIVLVTIVALTVIGGMFYLMTTNVGKD